MIRKAIIVVLTFATIGTSCLATEAFGGAYHRFRFWRFRVRTEAKYWSLAIKFEYTDQVVLFDTVIGGLDGCNEPMSVRMQSYRGFYWLHRPTGWESGFPNLGIPPSTRYVVYCGVPLWLPLLLFPAYPAFALVRGPLRRWRRHRKGLCIRCGYNLEGNVSGTCSECGNARTGCPVESR